MKPELKKIVFGASLLCIGLLVALFALEAVVRVLGLAQQTKSFYQPDPLIGTRHVPYANGIWQKKGIFSIEVKFNGEGFRDVDHAVKKPKGVRRIIVLGDSYVEAMQVEFQQAFYSVLEKRLNTESGKGTVEVINFGVSGFGVPQYYLALKHYGYKYDPDLVILAVTTGNDIRNAHPDLELDKYRPYYLFNEKGEMYLQPPQQQNTVSMSILPSLVRNIVTLLFPQSYIYVNQTIGPRIWAFRAQQKNANTAKPEAAKSDAAKTSPPRPEISIDTYVYGVPYTKPWADAWKATLELIKMMKHELDERGAKLLVVTITDSDAQIDGSLQKQLDGLKVGNLQWDAERPVKILDKFCRQQGIEFLPLLYGFRQEYRKTHEKFHFVGDGHWTARSHELSASLLYDKIRKDGLLK